MPRNETLQIRHAATKLAHGKAPVKKKICFLFAHASSAAALIEDEFSNGHFRNNYQQSLLATRQIAARRAQRVRSSRVPKFACSGMCSRIN